MNLFPFQGLYKMLRKKITSVEKQEIIQGVSDSYLGVVSLLSSKDYYVVEIWHC